MEPASTAIGQARALLDPTGSQAFSDAKLLPYLNIAARQMRTEGASKREATFAEAVVVLQDVPAGTLNLSAYIQPGKVLATLANPLMIWEKVAGTTDDNYFPVRRVDELPSRIQQNYLLEYQWLGGNVVFLGATQALDIKIQFEQVWPAIKGPEDALPAIDIAGILGYWTAGLYARAMREETLAQTYIAEARHLLYRWLNEQVKDAQNITRRPRPFRPHDDPSYIRQL